MNVQVSPIDIGILVGYLALSRIIPLWINRNRTESSDGFFLGGRSFTWPLIGFSLFATNMSGSTFVGLASAGYKQGLSVYAYEFMAALILVFFVFFMLPFYLKTGVYTMPEFLERRYGTGSRKLFSGLLIFFHTFVDAAGALYAGALVGRLLFPELDLVWFVLALAALSGLMSIVGGLGAVVISDTIQAIVLIIGGVIIFFAAQDAVSAAYGAPAMDVLREQLTGDTLHIIRPADDPNLPWPGLLTGLIIIGIYYWTTNQSMVQRTLGAKNIDQGRWGALFAGLLKLPILWLMIFPGVFAILLFPDLSNPDDAFPRLMAELLPVGIKGVMMAALVAAITSSVDSIMNSAGTLVTMDFVRPAYPNMPEERVVRIGRWSTSVVMFLAIAWAPMITMFPSLWDYLQAVLSYMAPPIVVLFLTGIFWQGASRRAANLTLSVGLAGGLIGFVAGEVYDAYSMHFLYAALVSFLVSGVLLVVLSHVWPDTSGKDAPDLIWTKKVWQEESASLAGVAWWKNYRLQALVLAVLTLSIVYYYR